MNERQASVAAEIASLSNKPMADLWQIWDKYFPRRPEYPNRNYVESRIAYKIQEEVFGGLSADTKRRLEAIGQKYSKIKLRASRREFNFVPGTVFLRQDAQYYRPKIPDHHNHQLPGSNLRLAD